MSDIAPKLGDKVKADYSGNQCIGDVVAITDKEVCVAFVKKDNPTVVGFDIDDKLINGTFTSTYKTISNLSQYLGRVAKWFYYDRVTIFCTPPNTTVTASNPVPVTPTSKDVVSSNKPCPLKYYGIGICICGKCRDFRF